MRLIRLTEKRIDHGGTLYDVGEVFINENKIVCLLKLTSSWMQALDQDKKNRENLIDCVKNNLWLLEWNPAAGRSQFMISEADALRILKLLEGKK